MVHLLVLFDKILKVHSSSLEVLEDLGTHYALVVFLIDRFHQLFDDIINPMVFLQLIFELRDLQFIILGYLTDGLLEVLQVADDVCSELAYDFIENRFEPCQHVIQQVVNLLRGLFLFPVRGVFFVEFELALNFS